MSAPYSDGASIEPPGPDGSANVREANAPAGDLTDLAVSNVVLRATAWRLLAKLAELPDRFDDGLSDIIPANDLVRTAAYARAVAEVLFLSVFIARVVSLYDRHHESHCAKG